MKPSTLALAAALAFGTSVPVFAGSYNNDFSSGVGAASLRESAVLDSGSVRLTPNVIDNLGSLVINDLDPGSVVTSFDASFTLAIGPGSTPPADGVSFSFGAPPPGTDAFGESGTWSGVAVVFDIFNNGETPTPPVIRVLWNGVQVAAAQGTLFSSGAFQPVTIHYDSNGLDVDFNSGGIVLTNVALSGGPQSGSRFTFGARTGSLSAEQRIDDVAISTTAVARARPAPVPTLAEWATAALAMLLAALAAMALRRREVTGPGSSRRR